MAFLNTPVTTTQGALASNQIPIGEVYTPSTLANPGLNALQGGPGSTDANSNMSAAVALYVPDGNDVTQGTTTQTKATDGSATSWSVIQLLKGMFDKLLNTLAVTQSGIWTMQPGNTANTTAWKVDNSAVTQPANITQINGTAISNTNPAPMQWVSQSGYVTLSSPPAATTAATDTSFTFSSQVNTVNLENNTAAVLNYAFDTAATAGSRQLAAGASLIYNKKVTVVHILTTLAANVNGSTTPNIVLLGEL